MSTTQLALKDHVRSYREQGFNLHDAVMLAAEDADPYAAFRVDDDRTPARRH